MHELVCVGCSRKFKAKTPTAKWCDGSGGACQRRNKRAARAEGAAEGRPVKSPKDGPLVCAVIDQLHKAGVVDTVDGQIAIRIAREVVVAKGTQVSTLTDKLSVVLERATGVTPKSPASAGPAAEPVEETPEEPDELELARRRAAELRDKAATG